MGRESPRTVGFAGRNRAARAHVGKDLAAHERMPLAKRTQRIQVAPNRRRQGGGQIDYGGTKEKREEEERKGEKRD